MAAVESASVENLIRFLVKLNQETSDKSSLLIRILSKVQKFQRYYDLCCACDHVVDLIGVVFML